MNEVDDALNLMLNAMEEQNYSASKDYAESNLNNIDKVSAESIVVELSAKSQNLRVASRVKVTEVRSLPHG